MQRVLLKPILQRTFTIFRERPLLFTAPSLFLSLLLFRYTEWFTSLSRSASIALHIWGFGGCLVGSAISFSLICAMTIASEEGESVSLRNAWRCISNQSGLAATAARIEGMFCCVFAALFVLVIVFDVTFLTLHLLPHSILTPGKIHPIGTTIFVEVLWVTASILLYRISLSIPLLLIRKPAPGQKYHPLKEGRQLSTGALGAVAWLWIGSMLPLTLLRVGGRLIELPPTLAVPAEWLGSAFTSLLGSILCTLSYMAITLIAIDRNAADQTQKSFQPTEPVTQPTQQIAIL